MSALYEPSGWLGTLIEGMTTNITGDTYLTYLLLIIILATMMLALFKIPFEITALSLMSVFLVLLAYSSEWLPFFGLLAILFAFMIARYWFSD